VLEEHRDVGKLTHRGKKTVLESPLETNKLPEVYCKGPCGHRVGVGVGAVQK
jgi:hypothetical protein